jgi:hypothetical protein
MIMKNYPTLDLVQVRLRRKVGRDGLGTFAAFRMLLAKIGTKICCCSQLAKTTVKFGSLAWYPSPSLPTFLSYFRAFFDRSRTSLFSTP